MFESSELKDDVSKTKRTCFKINKNSVLTIYITTDFDEQKKFLFSVIFVRYIFELPLNNIY